MENARDSFYVALRNRLAALSPTRTTLVRGVWRPSILVEENESVVVPLPADVFVLRWTGVNLSQQHPLPLAEQTCEIAYATEGSDAHGGLDRGRMLAEMDREVAAMLSVARTQKYDYTQTPAAPLGTTVFWTDPQFAPVTTAGDRMSRTVRVQVYSFEEEGES